MYAPEQPWSATSTVQYWIRYPEIYGLPGSHGDGFQPTTIDLSELTSADTFSGAFGTTV